jgi:hypothetical protein
MGQFSVWHWIIVLFIVAIPVAILGLIWLVARASRRPIPPAAAAAPLAASDRRSVESRLQELNDLKDKNLITDAEYEQQRASILREV